MLGLAPANLVYGFDPASPDLIAWWTCDEGEGTVVGDSSGHGHDGAFAFGDPAWVEGVSGTAVELVGPTLVEVPAVNAELTEATMAGWIKPNGAQPDWSAFIMMRDPGLATGFNILGYQLAYHWNDDSATWSFRGGDMIAENDWTFAAVTIEPDKATFYVNGVPGSVNAVAHGPNLLNSNIYLGGDGTANWVSRRMNGALDDVALFSKALTADEIVDVMTGLELPPGPKIIWVSDGYDDLGDGASDDLAWVDLLEGAGYSVDYQINAVGDGYWRTLDDDKIAALNAADLIVVSRNSNSGDYASDATEVAQWNGITTPLILSSTHIIRSSRWKWVDSTTIPTLDAPMIATVPDSPLFDGVALDPNNMVMAMDGTVGPISFITADAGNGTLIAEPADSPGSAWIITWDAGVEFYPGSGEIAGGPRMFFAAGTQETAGVVGRGEMNLTPDGVKIFLNAVKYMMTPKDVTAPGDAIQGVPNDGDWPGAETPDLAIDDNTATKYLHFKGDFDPDPGTGGTGFQVTPAMGSTIVTGLTLTTANDVPGRDPIAFELSGSNDGIDGPYELIAKGDIVDFAQEVEWPRFTKNATPISFDNAKAYTNYQLIFTAIRGPVGGSVNSMQIAEVELLGAKGPAGPIVHYKLDETEGMIAADSADTLDGALMGDPMWTAGVKGGALDLDGDGDYVDCGTNEAINSLGEAMTVTAWVNIRSVTTAWMAIATKGETAWRLGVNNTTTGIHWGFTGGDRGWQQANSVTELPLGEWHHVGGTYDSSVGGTVYVDGVAEAVNPNPDGVDNNDQPLLLGENPEATGRFFDGLLDDVRIYDRALSDAEMMDLAGVQPKVLVASYGLDTAANDSSGNGLDGTIMGDPNFVDGKVGMALMLDGVDDYVDLGNPSALDFGTGDFTIAAWINMTAIERGTVYAKGADNSGGIRYTLAMGESNDNKMTLTTDDNSDKVQARGDTVVNDGQWHHVVGMRSGNTSVVYVDGVFDGIADLPEGYDLSGASQANALIGAIDGDADPAIVALEKFFAGAIDDVRIYNYALSDAEVADLALLPTQLLPNGGFESGDIAPYGLYGNATGEVVTDCVDAVVPEGPVEGAYCLHVVVPEAGANNWDVGMTDGSYTLKAGKTYTFSAFLKCKSGTLDFRMKPERGADPWEGYNDQVFTMTDTWQEFTVTTDVIPADVTPASPTFHFAFAAGDFWVDNVRLYENR